MSASPVFSSAALGRPFIFPALPRANSPVGSNDDTGAPVFSLTESIESALAHPYARANWFLGKPVERSPAESSPKGASQLSPALQRRVGSNKLRKSRRDDPALPPARSSASLLACLNALSKLAAPVTPASRLDVRPAPEMVSTGIREFDALTGGLPRGCLTEICGPASSGRTSILFSALARATQRGEVCALVDASDAFDPASAAAAGVQMEHLLWIRCGKKSPPRRHKAMENTQEPLNSSVSPCLRGGEQRISESQLEQVLKVTDLLLQSNGFGMIVLDLGDIPLRSARRIPLASWFRFRRAVEHTPTVLLVLEQQPIAGSCSSLLLQVSGVRCQASGNKHSAFSTQHSVNQPGHTQLLDEFRITVELLRSRLDRKQPQSVTSFRSHAAWA